MKTRKEIADSGGNTTVSSEWMPFHKQDAGDAGNTGFAAEEETPNGGTPIVFTSTSGELPQGKTQPEFTCERSFMGLSLDDLYIIEICAGSARLSKAAHESGFKTMAVDHTTSRSCGFPICVFDLTDPQDLASILRFIDEAADCIVGIWVAPSCGTCSRAREKRLPQLESAGMKVPYPLRSTAQPDQLDGLSGLDKVKVEKANMLYDAVYEIATNACLHQIFVAIENPTNSHYWSTSAMQRLCRNQVHHYVTFHNCAHGGDWDKSTSLWVNDSWLDELAILCDKKHVHKPWTTTLKHGGVKFSTSEEAAYPNLLCERVINCFKRAALKCGAQAPQSLSEQAEGPTKDKLSRIVLGALPRGHKLKPLVAEFGSFFTIFVDPQKPSLVNAFLDAKPKGAKVVSRRIVTRGEMQAAQLDKTEGSNFTVLEVGDAEVVEKLHVGIPSEPDDFIERAVLAGHPRSLEQFLDPQVEDMLKANFVGPPLDLAKRRLAFFNKYLSRAKELAAAEEQMRAAMPDHVRLLVGNKRLLLLKEVLSDMGYPDESLVDEIAQGFKLSGWLNKSFVFKPRVKRPSMSLHTLKRLAHGPNASTLQSMVVRQENTLEGATWEETVEEEKKGWIWFDDEELRQQTKFAGAVLVSDNLIKKSDR